ncbi:MAG: TetR family transcriptional regulator C-terminal domain-containing protein [Myxococcota bacterium]
MTKPWARDGGWTSMTTRRADVTIKGCFAANASAEMAPRDPEIAHLLRGFTARLVTAFQRAIDSGQTTGELTADIDSKIAAELLAITMFGLQVVGTHSPRSSGLVDAILAPLG